MRGIGGVGKDYRKRKLCCFCKCISYTESYWFTVPNYIWYKDDSLHFHLSILQPDCDISMINIQRSLIDRSCSERCNMLLASNILTDKNLSINTQAMVTLSLFKMIIITVGNVVNFNPVKSHIFIKNEHFTFGSLSDSLQTRRTWSSLASLFDFS